MKAKDLIAALQNLDPETILMIYDEYEYDGEVSSIEHEIEDSEYTVVHEPDSGKAHICTVSGADRLRKEIVEDQGTGLVPGYELLERIPGVCDGRTIITNTRMRPCHVVGFINDTDFATFKGIWSHISDLAIEECFRYMKEFPEDGPDLASQIRNGVLINK